MPVASPHEASRVLHVRGSDGWRAELAHISLAMTRPRGRELPFFLFPEVEEQ